MSASTPPPVAPPAAPPIRGWDNILTIVIPVASVVAAVAMVIITYQVSRISDLGSDVKNVNNRVDQLFPLISQSTADIGIIKGSLVATAQQIATAAERNEDVSKRLDALVANQEGQSKNIQELTVSVSSLVSAIKGEQQQLDEIKGKINFIPSGENFLFHDATLFVPSEQYKVGVISAKSSGASVVPINWNNREGESNFFKLLSESNLDFGKIILTTKDAGVAESLKQAIAKAGLKGQ